MIQRIDRHISTVAFSPIQARICEKVMLLGKDSMKKVAGEKETAEDGYLRSFARSIAPGVSPGPGLDSLNMAAVKGFIVAAAKAQGSSELALYVTHDTDTWHRAEFGDHRIEEDAYTLLESTNYSIQIQVTPDGDVDLGVLFSSNFYDFASYWWVNLNRQLAVFRNDRVAWCVP